MCGRITLTITPEEIAELLGVKEVPRVEPRYNIAPTQTAAVVRNVPGIGREAALLRWGMVRYGPAPTSAGLQLINARCETITQKPAFREAFKSRRCLVLSDGFYEWRRSAKKKQPHLIRMKNHKPFAMAGLWETLKLPDGACDTFTILTTNSNELVAPLHDRMPVILAPEAYETWLNPEITDPAVLKPLLKSFPAEKMECIPVNSFVNNANNEGVKCIAPPEIETPKPTLFD